MSRTCCFEPLEPRLAFDAVVWSGAGDGVHWHDPANWDLGRVPGPADSADLRINDAGPVIRVTEESGHQVVGSIISRRAMELTGGVLEVVGTADFRRFPVEINGGGIAGGTWIFQEYASFGSAVESSIRGPIEIQGIASAGACAVRVTGGLRMQGEFRLHEDAVMTFEGPQTFEGAAISVYSHSTNPAYIMLDGPADSVLTLGADAQIISDTGSSDNLRVEGTSSQTLRNEGLIRLSRGSLRVATQRFENAGRLETAGASLAIYSPEFLNTGVADISGGTLSIGSTLTTEELGLANIRTSSNGRLYFTGTLLNHGAVLELTTDIEDFELGLYGELRGGAVVVHEGRRLGLRGGSFLEGVAVTGDIEALPNSTNSIYDGLDLDGTLYLIPHTTLRFVGSQTFGSGSIRFEGSGGNGGTYINLEGGGDATLTIGADAAIHCATNSSPYPAIRSYGGSMGLVNRGRITSSAWGFRVDAATITNHGILAGVDGGAIEIAGTITNLGRMGDPAGTLSISGRLLNTGLTQRLDATTGGWVLDGAIIEGGAIEMFDGVTLRTSTSRFGQILGPLRVSGDFDCTAFSSGLKIEGGLLLDGVVRVGNQGYVQFIDTQTFSTGTILLDSQGTQRATVSVVSGTTLTLGPDAIIRQVSEVDQGIIWDGYGAGTLINYGLIEAVASQGIQMIVQRIENHGTIATRAGGRIYVRGSGDIVGGTLERGRWVVEQDGLLQFYQGAIRRIGAGASVRISGSGSRVDGMDPALAGVDGLLELADGAALAAAPAGGVFELTGRLELGTGTSLSITGDYLQGAGSTLIVRAAGTGPGGLGRLLVSGGASLAGAFVAEYVGGFVPLEGDSFAFLVGGGDRTGEYGSVSLPPAPETDKSAILFDEQGVRWINTDLADMNLDGRTDSRDFVVFLQWWAGGDGAADLNGDGVLDSRDFVYFFRSWADG